ncbi:CidA/LrgA family protein [Aureimonas mangrovi]|uniref:CidA/LrgA family protein n=1 Tax=Aureimonas mangrovi TaxID=2758041 RepID=UPI00163D679E|nr:CidA/LrgA family protein [Aureimonas mangrovi]
MLRALTAIFLFQLAGELLAASLGLPLPGPVIGMMLLFIFLLVRGRGGAGVPAGIGRVADGLLAHLSLLFVPAGAGIMLHVARIEREALPIGVTLVVATLATIAATGLAMRFLNRGTPR